MIDALLRDFKLASANGVRTPIGDDCHADDYNDSDFLPASGVSGSQDAPARHLFRSA